MALPDDHDEPDEHAAAPLLPPEDRLWRHPAELRSHPLSPTNLSAPPAPPQHADRPAGLRVALAAVACMTGMAMVAGVLWVTWPRESADLAGDTESPVDLPPTSLDDPPIGASASRGQFSDLFSSASQGPASAPSGRLGVQVVDFATAVPGLPVWRAAEVVEVEHASAAHGVGLLPGDLIVGVEHHHVESAADLVRAVGEHRPGDLIEVRVTRHSPDGMIHRHVISVRLGT